MGLFYPMLLVPDVYPPPPRSWSVMWIKYSITIGLHMRKPVVTSATVYVVYFSRFHDYEDMLEDTWHVDFPRRSDISDGLYPSMNVGLPMWDSFPIFAARPKKEEKVGLAEAITSSILSTGSLVTFILLHPVSDAD